MSSEDEASVLNVSLGDSLQFLQGDPFEIEDDKYYVLEFWATWCPPCVSSIPHLNELYTKYSSNNTHINFVGITNGDHDTLMSFVTAHSSTMTYPVANDVDRRLHAAFDIKGIPKMYILHGNRILWNGHPMDVHVEVVLTSILITS
jgi:thiol-disulfide isomerase/thioredoxin